MLRYLGVVLAMVGCLLYVTVCGIIVTRVIAGNPALDDPHTRADQSEAIHTPASQSGGLSGAPRVVAITVEDAACEHTCVGRFKVDCTTTQVSVSAAWILVAQGEFETQYRELGCAAALVDRVVDAFDRVVESYPVTGKAQKFKMREMAITELGLETAAAVRTA